MKWCTTKKLFTYLRQRYDRGQIENLNYIVKLRGKIRTLKWNKIFLGRCISRKVAPTFIKQRLEKTKVKPSWKIQLAFMNEEMEDIQRRTTKLNSTYRNNWRENTMFLNFFDKIRLCKYLANVELRMEEKTTALHDRRIDFLIKKRYGDSNMSSGACSLINLSKYQLTDEESFALKLGLNFCVPFRSISREQIASEIEMLYYQVHSKLQPASEIKLKELKAKLHDITYAYAGSTADKHDLPLLKRHLDAIRSLRNNQEILITKPDKGTGTVVIDRSSYFERIKNEILGDTSKFKHLGTVDIMAQSKSAENVIRVEIKRLFDNKLLSKEEREDIQPIGSQIPRLYGLPKIHKKDNPYRPILSMVNSPQERLAKWLLKFLKPAEIFFTKYCVKDSFTFSKEIRSLESTDSSLYMVSYDVCSLFTNVPVRETISITADYLYDECDQRPSISKDTFKKLMELATVGVKFIFGDSLYEQTDGVAMGSPLGPALANIFLGYHEDQLFSKSAAPLYYRRYVDDTFVMLRSKEDADKLHFQLNKLHDALRFTTEPESEGKLPFLDVLVERVNGKLVTSVYRKKTYTGHYMKWNSFAPTQRKLNLIHTLVLRALSICSPSRVEDELATIKSIMLKNGYPSNIVDTHMSRKMDRFNSSPHYGPKRCPAYVKLPWIGEKSIAFEHKIKKAVRLCFPAADVRVCYSTKSLMQFKTKTALPILLRSKVIYEFQCLCGKGYIGRTNQRLVDRIAQHVPLAIRKPGTTKTQPTAEKQTSAIGKHLCESKQCADGYNSGLFSVVDSARSSFQLSTLEAAYISTRNPILCRQKSFVYVLKVCKGL